MGCTNLTNKRKHISIIKKATNSTGGSAHSSNEQIGGEKTKSTSDSEVQNIPKNSIHIELHPNTVGKMLELWVEKGNCIKFHVNGKWTIYDDQPFVSHRGYQSLPLYRNFHIAALIGYVPGGGFFKILDGVEIMADATGPLVLVTNDRDENTYSEGLLNVYIEGAIPTSYEEIELKLGWDRKSLLDFDEDIFTPLEYEVLLILNKLRQSPKDFARQYITHLTNDKVSYRELYDKLTYTSMSRPFRPMKGLSLAAKASAFALGQSGLTCRGGGSDELRSLVAEYCETFGSITECVTFNILSPCNIILKILENDGYNLLCSGAFSQVGISIEKHITYNWVCVLVLGNKIKDKA
jgi:hypothetical protein